MINDVLVTTKGIYCNYKEDIEEKTPKNFAAAQRPIVPGWPGPNIT